MDRALDLGLLQEALDGQQPTLPSPDELQDLLAEAETRLFLRQTVVPDDLLRVGWFLHAVASVDQAQDIYSVPRQRRAFAVSAHIFDLALADRARPRGHRLQLAFAAAVGYRRGDLDPNAGAVLRRLQDDVWPDRPVLEHVRTLALETGLALLCFDTQRVFPWFRGWRRQLQDLAALVGLESLTTTAYGTTEAVVLGAEDLLQFLARGDRDRLRRAQGRLEAAVRAETGPAEHLARWVAAHLLALGGEAFDGSVFSLLPPELPDAARHAFTLAPPAVLTLWRPQRELLSADPSPLSPETRRLVLSIPTSSGKTLLAQLLAVAHLAQQSTGVCYVAPTRSLCREVRRAMATRVRLLQKEVAQDAPDFSMSDLLQGTEDPWDALSLLMENLRAHDSDVEVMTPERLAHLLRHDAPDVLTRFGLFIFDEAQLVQEPGRGFTLESTIALLHHLTRQRHHRIVLLSAALGNAGQVMQWVDPDHSGLLHESTWRGPRRLHALFSTRPDWNSKRIQRVASKKAPYRAEYEQYGVVTLRPADGRPIRRLETAEPVGLLSLKATSPDQQSGRQKDTTRSTKDYVAAAEMIRMLGHAGSVLVVNNTRDAAKRMAVQLAQGQPRRAAFVPLADFARQQLGPHHPLVAALARGVGYHHAGLPTEVLEAVEDALRNDQLPYLACTSTLTEGVNLPVRTVVLYDETYLPQARLSGGRLVNAMGRAGRAGKESEGWIVLLRPGSSSDQDLHDLQPSSSELEVRSTLADADALAAVAALEEATRTGSDVIFQVASGGAADFVSFVWLFLATVEAFEQDPAQADLRQLLGDTLAAQQVPAATLAGWNTAAGAVRTAYTNTPSAARRRWARAGTSLPTAIRLDDIASRLVAAVRALPEVEAEQLHDPAVALDLLVRLGLLNELLELPENTTPWRFRRSLRGEEIDLSPGEALHGWISGTALAQLADELLAAAPDPVWRITQLVDHVTAHFEHFLSWTLGALIGLVNEALEADALYELCPELPGYVRYGVNTRTALALMLSGVRSRRLAHEIVRQVDPEQAAEDVISMLGDLSLNEWRDQLNASPSEILDLLDVTRRRRGSFLRPLLETGAVSVPVQPIDDATLEDTGPIDVQPVADDPPPARLGVYAAGRLVATVPSAVHADVAAVIDTGLELNMTLDLRAGELLALALALATGDASP